MDYKMVDISDKISIPVPTTLTPEQEGRYIAEYRATHLARLEAEEAELEDMLSGKTPACSMDELLAEIAAERQSATEEPA